MDKNQNEGSKNSSERKKSLNKQILYIVAIAGGATAGIKSGSGDVTPEMAVLLALIAVVCFGLIFLSEWKNHRRVKEKQKEMQASNANKSADTKQDTKAQTESDK